MLHKSIRRNADDAHRYVAIGSVGDSRLLDHLQHARPETAGDDALFEGHDELLASGLVEDQLTIERLRIAGIDQADRPAVLLEQFARLPTPFDNRAEADDQDLAALPQQLAHAHRQHLGDPGRDTEARVARVMQRERMRLREGGSDERTEFLLVFWAGDDHVRQLALGRQREHALVARPVFADQSGSVDGYDHRQIVLTDVMHFLVEGPLQERRVNSHDRPLPCQSHPGRERDGMLLGDPNVYEAVRELLLERVKTGAGGHPSRNRHNPAVNPRQLDEFRGEVIRVVGRPGRGGCPRRLGRSTHVRAAGDGVAVAGGLDWRFVGQAGRRHGALFSGHGGAGQGLMTCGRVDLGR